MWKVVPGIPLSLLPRRWRAVSPIPEESVPWVSAAILSGILESIFAVVALVYWYSHSVTTWAAQALDSGAAKAKLEALARFSLGEKATV